MQTSVPVEPDAVGDQARVAAAAEGAVHHDVARAGVSSVDQLAGQHRHMRAGHVKKDGQGLARSRTISRVQARPGRPATLSRSQTSRWSITPTTTTSFWIPPCSMSAGLSVTRPAESSSIVERVAREEARELAPLAR